MLRSYSISWSVPSYQARLFSGQDQLKLSY